MEVRQVIDRGRGAPRPAPRVVAVARTLLLFEAATFLAAAAVHAGVLVEAHRHNEAAIAETVIAVVLIVAVALNWTPEPWPLRFALSAQGFALAGTLVGLFTIAVGVGPRTLPDVAYHLGILVVLIAGLAELAPTAMPGRRRVTETTSALRGVTRRDRTHGGDS